MIEVNFTYTDINATLMGLIAKNRRQLNIFNRQIIAAQITGQSNFNPSKKQCLSWQLLRRNEYPGKNENKKSKTNILFVFLIKYSVYLFY